jgi:F0F1-type ATP synthase membrane subunit a
MIGELMAVMQHDVINPISPILSHFDEQTRLDWSWTNWFSNFTSFFTIIPIIIISLVVYIFLRNNNTADSSSSEQVYYHQPFSFIPPTPESTPAIRRKT